MKTKEISFDVSKEDSALIYKIAKRAAKSYNLGLLDLQMDITATHANGNPLDLQKLLDADEFNFGHDIWGIRRHLKRNTGELMNCFLPRCSR